LVERELGCWWRVRELGYWWRVRELECWSAARELVKVLVWESGQWRLAMVLPLAVLRFAWPLVAGACEWPSVAGA
jgi:hypothetical protein